MAQGRAYPLRSVALGRQGASGGAAQPASERDHRGNGDPSPHPAPTGSPLEDWLRNIRDVQRLHAAELAAISDPEEKVRGGRAEVMRRSWGGRGDILVVWM